MGQCAVAQRKPPGVGDAFLGLLTLHHLGGEKELLLGQGWLIGRSDKACAGQTNDRAKN
jgi:hypothetical protein